MVASKISDQVRGKSIRMTWSGGPTKGTAHDHLFHADGTVEWHEVDSDTKAKTFQHDKAAAKDDRPACSAVKITDNVCLISYLSKSGYTLTVALNFKDGTSVGAASNETTWFPVKGTFEVLG
jgi:hypothetical protein